jgi:zinc transporter ZupT
MPLQIADYSILIKSGLTKRQAMASQFFTAVGAFVGTFLGIWIAESAGAGSGAVDKGIDLAAVVAGKGAGFLGTSVLPSDLVIPATAGGKSPEIIVSGCSSFSSAPMKDSCTSHRSLLFRNCWKKAEV